MDNTREFEQIEEDFQEVRKLAIARSWLDCRALRLHTGSAHLGTRLLCRFWSS